MLSPTEINKRVNQVKICDKSDFENMRLLAILARIRNDIFNSDLDHKEEFIRFIEQYNINRLR